MMETSYLRQGPHRAHFRWLNSSVVGAIHREGQMGTRSVVIGEIRGEHSPKMLVVEDDDMIKHLATETPNEPLAVGILPWTARGDLHFFDADVLDAALERHTVDRVPIPEEIAWRGLPGKRLNDLLGGPLRRRVFSDVEMHDTSALVSQHDKHKQDLEAGSWNGEEITRHDVFDVILEKGLPRG